ncbi:hypothetical protein BC835DRAFT_1415715 [Cytidiella melzeri]|nr:hypothetical protein BC835DRAFT_1415715 [Cytidiella melzeri]
MGPSRCFARVSTTAANSQEDTQDLQEDSTYVNLLECIRTTLAKSSISSMFVPQDPIQLKDASIVGQDLQQETTNRVTPSNSHRLAFFDDARRVMKDLSPSRLRSRAGSLTSKPTAPEASLSSTMSQILTSVRSSESASSGQSDSDTPPLTPDSSRTKSVAHSVSQASLEPASDTLEGLAAIHSRVESTDDDYLRSRQESELIKAGKQRERQVCYETLIADISPEDATAGTPVDAYGTDQDDWFGLEETIELSLRERRASDCYSPAVQAGEFSKSYDSWAAMHDGYVHPMSIEREYRRWRRWHKNLDIKLQERGRIMRTFRFLHESKKMSEIYVNEWYKQDWVEYHKLNGDPDNTTFRVREELAVLSSYRPDPYFPAVKHNLAWVLKTSRSSSCLRELRPLADLA